MKSCVTLLLILVTRGYLCGQDQADSSSSDSSKYQLTESQLQDCEAAALQSINDFQNYLQIITKKTNSKSQIENAKYLALKLFVNDTTIVETSSKNTNTIKHQTIRSYLNAIAGLGYSNITIEFYSFYISSNLTKIEGTNTYAGIATYYQYFKGCYKEGGCRSDVTKKNIEFFVEIIPVYNGTETSLLFAVKLGDIYVVETK